jgi:hypothetical protein
MVKRGGGGGISARANMTFFSLFSCSHEGRWPGGNWYSYKRTLMRWNGQIHIHFGQGRDVNLAIFVRNLGKAIFFYEG